MGEHALFVQQAQGLVDRRTRDVEPIGELLRGHMCPSRETFGVDVLENSSCQTLGQLAAGSGLALVGGFVHRQPVQGE